MFENTSMHGLKYIAEDHRHFFERLFWVFIFTAGLSVSLYLVLNIWFKYIEQPTVNSIENTAYPLINYEFPAVTICPQNNISKKKLSQVMKSSRYKAFTSDEMLFMIRVMMKIHFAANRTDDVTRLGKLLVGNGISIDEMVSPSLNQLKLAVD